MNSPERAERDQPSTARELVKAMLWPAIVPVLGRTAARSGTGASDRSCRLRPPRRPPSLVKRPDALRAPARNLDDVPEAADDAEHQHDTRSRARCRAADRAASRSPRRPTGRRSGRQDALAELLIGIGLGRLAGPASPPRCCARVEPLFERIEPCILRELRVLPGLVLRHAPLPMCDAALRKAPREGRGTWRRQARQGAAPL